MRQLLCAFFLLTVSFHSASAKPSESERFN